MMPVKTKECWVLLESHNDYDQHGEYFLAVFEREPTEADLPYWDHTHFDRKHNEDVWVTKEKVPVFK